MTSAMQQCLKLSSGGLMPVIGFGTWQIKTDVENVITKALEVGYRHIDTAHAYHNESGVGNAIARYLQTSGLKREDLFIVTKLPGLGHRSGKVVQTLEGCLGRLQLSYVDLFLIHSPMATMENSPDVGKYPSDKYADIVDTWKGMEDAYNKGLTKAIGLSNFNSLQIGRILNSCSIKPANLQVECHAYFQQKDLFSFCRERGITFTAYSPIGRPGLINKDGVSEPVLIEDERVIAIGKKYGKTAAQVALRFLIQLGMIVIPKSINEGRMKENFQVFDFNLEDEDMTAMKSLDKHLRFVRFDHVPGQTDHPEYPFKAAF